MIQFIFGFIIGSVFGAAALIVTVVLLHDKDTK